MTKTIDEKAAKLLKELDITKLKDISTKTNILMQQQLQQLMLSYIVDIKEQLSLKQDDLVSTYPTELVGSLKIISDLYLKMKAENNLLKTNDNDYNSPKVFQEVNMKLVKNSTKKTKVANSNYDSSKYNAVKYGIFQSMLLCIGKIRMIMIIYLKI